MPKQTQGKYNTKTESAVKEALIELLATKPLVGITTSELARAANVSRSTFYEHYGSPADVYDELVEEFAKEMSPLLEQVACSDQLRPKGKPFCICLREPGKSRSIARDERFLGSFLGQGFSADEHDLYTLLTRAGYTARQAEALCAFQLSGCFSATRATQATDEEWEEIRTAIDRFILGGISACLAAKAN